MFTTREGNNFAIDSIEAIAGIVGSPVALLIGLFWLLPAYCLDLPYLGKPQFFIDATVWLLDSIMSACRCIIFPMAMIHAYNTTGSMNVLKGEYTRIVDTLLARIDQLPSANLIIDPARGGCEL